MPRTAILIVGSLLSVIAVVYATCAWELFFTAEKRALIELKNRTTLPAPADIDPLVTLDSLLNPGDDRARWSSAHGATIEGLVVGLFEARPESANCYSLTRRDVHIEIARRPDAPLQERVTVEVTPAFRERAAMQGIDWSPGALKRDLLGRRVRVTGWLLFDTEHDDEAEHTQPDRRDNWRATAWEIHPVTEIALLPH
jgi:hypothetical protein